MSVPHTTHLQALLNQFHAGRASARDELMAHAMGRFQTLARKMFRNYPDLRGIEDTDDVVQKAMIRFLAAFTKVKPTSVGAFFGLAARQVRWVLLDMVRAHQGAPRSRPLDDTVSDGEMSDGGLADPTGEPATLLEWANFHECIEQLPEEHRIMCDLLFYAGLSQAEAAQILEVSVRTVKRRWQQARLTLKAALNRDLPGDSQQR